MKCENCGQGYPIIDDIPFFFCPESIKNFIQIDEQRRNSGKTQRKNIAGGAYHWQEYKISEFLPTPAQGKDVMLLGCGDAGERTYLHDIGFETVAFDVVRSQGTDFLADAHKIPLGNATFDGVISMQVLEHLHSPWIAVQEISRILKPGGWFVGSVAFLKPYHNSYFHMTHKGAQQLLSISGLVIDKIMGAQSITYTIYGTMLPLGKRSVSRFVYGTVDAIINYIRTKLWVWRTGLKPDQPTERFNAGFPFSFKDFQRIRFAPSIVFRVWKNESEL